MTGSWFGVSDQQNGVKEHEVQLIQARVACAKHLGGSLQRPTVHTQDFPHLHARHVTERILGTQGTRQPRRLKSTPELRSLCLPGVMGR